MEQPIIPTPTQPMRVVAGEMIIPDAGIICDFSSVPPDSKASYAQAFNHARADSLHINIELYINFSCFIDARGQKLHAPTLFVIKKGPGRRPKREGRLTSTDACSCTKAAHEAFD